MEKILVTSVFPFPTMFSQGLFLSGVNSHHCVVNPFPNDKFKLLPNRKNLQTTYFRFDENGRKFLKQVENNVGKREIAHYEQFLLFLYCF